MLRSASYIIPAKWHHVVSLLLIFVFAGPFQIGAQSLPGGISIEKGGKVWIEGSAGMINFSCQAEKLSGVGEVENARNPQSTVKGKGQVHISVALPVRSLDCGKRAMNKDMYEALKADNHATIRYRLLDAALADKQTKTDLTDTWMPIRTQGIMEIAGVQDTTTIYVEGKVLSNQRFRVKGSKQLHMDTFRIKPPSAMFGLIRADKELTVHFDVTVRLGNFEEYSQSPLPLTSK